MLGLQGAGVHCKSRIEHGIHEGRYRIVGSYCTCRYGKRVYGLRRYRERGKTSRHMSKTASMEGIEGGGGTSLRTPQKVGTLYRSFERVHCEVEDEVYENGNDKCPPRVVPVLVRTFF